MCSQGNSPWTSSDNSRGTWRAQRCQPRSERAQCVDLGRRGCSPQMRPSPISSPRASLSKVSRICYFSTPELLHLRTRCLQISILRKHPSKVAKLSYLSVGPSEVPTKQTLQLKTNLQIRQIREILWQAAKSWPIVKRHQVPIHST